MQEVEDTAIHMQNINKKVTTVDLREALSAQDKEEGVAIDSAD